MPLLRCLPLDLHSSWRMKSLYLPTVCKSPGPSLTLMALSMTANFDLYLSPGKVFQPARSLPLKRGLVSSVRSLILRYHKRAFGSFPKLRVARIKEYPSGNDRNDFLGFISDWTVCEIPSG